jgi:hypothetical protein
MATNSDIILYSTSHDSFHHLPVDQNGDKYKGDGFYGFGDGYHTVQISLTSFIGTLKIQGTLVENPQTDDWTDIALTSTANYYVDTTGLISISAAPKSLVYTTAATNVKTYNFIGNFVWIRVRIENWTQGTINQILLNH